MSSSTFHPAGEGAVHAEQRAWLNGLFAGLFRSSAA